MTSDPTFFIKKIRLLSQALIISGILNIGVLTILLYWMLRENPPTPYCDLKPASIEEQQIPLVDKRGLDEALTQLSQFPFLKLVQCLSHSQLIENGYSERDLALACLISFHHFDIQRAIPKDDQPQQQRLLAWKPSNQDTATVLTVYPDLTQKQFDMISKFAKTEQWPLTAEGLFLLLKEQKQKEELNESLVETFILTPEFWTVELLFNRSGQRADRKEVLAVLLEGNWDYLKQFFEHQRQAHDLSEARLQKMLLDYLKAGSISASTLLLKMEWDFIVKKLDDQQVMLILKLMPLKLTESSSFAKEMLISPRSNPIRQQASNWLYTYAGESIPQKWDYQSDLMHFGLKQQNLSSAEPVQPKITAKQEGDNSLKSGDSNSNIKSNSSVANLKNPAKITSNKSESVKESKMIKDKKKLPTNSSKQQTYVVQEGDSLWKIARRFKVKIEEIKTLNDLKSDKLKPSTVLKIPSNEPMLK